MAILLKYKNKSPLPLFDTLKVMLEEKHQKNPSVVTRIESDAPANALADYNIACEFLCSYRGSADTFASYRREVERLLQWAWFVAGISLKDIRRAEIDDFLAFCQHPPKEWIGLKTVSRFVDQHGTRVINRDWRPFVSKVGKVEYSAEQTPDISNWALSQKSFQAIFSILSSFFNFLIQEEHSDVNPIALIRQKSKFIRKKQSEKIRRLSDLQWEYVIETAEMMANQDALIHERTLFVMNALYGMYLRISELTQSERWYPKMGDFQLDMDGNWWFITVGKGNKERSVSVSDEMLVALKRYRTYRNLSVLPYPGEQTPLIPKTRGSGGISSTRQIRNIVQTCFDAAVKRMIDDGFTEDSERLKTATVHWLRHTGISDDVKRRPREHVRDDAGHGSSAITDKYIDVELRERHASARKKSIKPS